MQWAEQKQSPSPKAGPVTLGVAPLDGLFIELNLRFLTCIVGIITFQIHNPFVAILKFKGFKKQIFLVNLYKIHLMTNLT